MVKIRFSISSGRLTVYSSNGLYSIRATSGKGACMNKVFCIQKKNEGPIPIGKYLIDKHKMTDLPFYKTLYHLMPFFKKKGSDWGDWYVPLNPVPGTEIFGRSGFYLHGGVFPGSAGCIDIGGGVIGNENTKKLMHDIVNEKFPITVEVA